MSHMSFLKHKHVFLAAFPVLLALLLAVLFLAGPRIKIDETLHPVTLPAQLDSYLPSSEAHFRDLTPGSEKKIIWAGKQGRQTPVALVYLHGFSATRQEVSPLCEHLAQQMGANLFLTRFKGHGRPGPALAEATVNDWLNDTHEALLLGRRLGKKTVLVAVSTGASLATWAAVQQKYPELAALILISPNYGLANPQGQMLGWPWGAQLAKLLLGPERIWQPANAEEARFWTWRYPVQALMPMMGVVQLVQAQNLQKITVPTLLIYAPRDTVVSPLAIERAFSRLGSAQKELWAFKQAEDPSQHILAGQIKSPQATPLVQAKIQAFLRRVLQGKNS